MRWADRLYSSTGTHEKQAYKLVGVWDGMYLLITASPDRRSITLLLDGILWIEADIIGRYGTTSLSCRSAPSVMMILDIHTV
jgi:hypothetical protein